MEQEKTPRERAGDLVSLLVSDWRPTPRQSLWAIRIATVLVVLIAIGYAYGITLWDWAKLLIVPAAIAFAGLWFNAQQKEREQNLAREHAQDEALQSYLDQMGRLLLDKDMELGKSKEGDEVRTLARAWTLLMSAEVAKRSDRIRSLWTTYFRNRLLTGVKAAGSEPGNSKVRVGPSSR